MLKPLDCFTGCRRLFCTIKPHRGRLEQSLDRECRFTSARNTRYTDKSAQGILCRYGFKVISGGINNRHGLAVTGTPFMRYFDFACAAQILTRQRFGIFGNLMRFTTAHHLPAMHSGTGTNVKDVICFSYRFFVMFHDNHSITLIAQVFKRHQQAIIVALMQTDRWFIKNVKNPRQPASNLTCETNALAFAARKRARIATEREIFQTNVVKKSQTFANFFQNCCSDFILLLGEAVGDAGAPFICVFNRHLNHLPDMYTGNFYG